MLVSFPNCFLFINLSRQQAQLCQNITEITDHKERESFCISTIIFQHVHGLQKCTLFLQLVCTLLIHNPQVYNHVKYALLEKKRE